ncbi:helix-turn-helix domain-containing protein [Actinopolyspora mortivallis]|uniref:helix-turn-helix domain-containing protein n=1 Tax=Actinopolyspora mortivallis TaxID=33906 RepID=UPI0003720B5B|nr:helix-turn-helix domain-containing protein [Actinopolyspora mortivallis]
MLQRSAGVTQSQLFGATNILQGRVSEIVNGSRKITAFEVYERIADGLNMPDEVRVLLGLAPTRPLGVDHLGAANQAELLATYPSQSSATPDIHRAAASASTIEIVAVRGLGILAMNDSLLRSVVSRSRPRVSALLLDPNGEAARRRASEVGESWRVFKSGVELSVSRLEELSAYTDVRVYFYDMLPTWRVLSLDDVQFVSVFGENHEGHTSRMYKIAESSHGALHRGFRRFTRELRNQAVRIV